MCWQDRGRTIQRRRARSSSPAAPTTGVIVTLIADNYYGYCKKEVKTQISYAANLFGTAEEEHAGGALAFPSYSLGDEFIADSRVATNGQHVRRRRRDLRRRGWTCSPKATPSTSTYPEHHLHPGRRRSIDLPTQTVSWTTGRQAEHVDQLLPDNVYMTPSGYKVRMEKHPARRHWRLSARRPRARSATSPAPSPAAARARSASRIARLRCSTARSSSPTSRQDLDAVDADLPTRITPTAGSAAAAAGLLQHARAARSSARALARHRDQAADALAGEYTDEYNAWLESIPNHIHALVFIIKRFYKPEWGDNWREHFSVDIVNGAPATSSSSTGAKLVGSYLRVGFDRRRQLADCSSCGRTSSPPTRSRWRTTSPPRSSSRRRSSPHLRTAGRTATRASSSSRTASTACSSGRTTPSIAGSTSRPKRTCRQPGTFRVQLSSRSRADEAREMVEDVVEFDQFTAPMQQLIQAAAAEAQAGYVVCSADPRIVDGKPTQEPALPADPPGPGAIRATATWPRWARGSTAASRPTSRSLFPVDRRPARPAQQPARPAAGIRALAVYNPIHYQELPELFMDFICRLTGKSPSTTGRRLRRRADQGPVQRAAARPPT